MLRYDKSTHPEAGAPYGTDLRAQQSLLEERIQRYPDHIPSWAEYFAWIDANGTNPGVKIDLAKILETFVLRCHEVEDPQVALIMPQATDVFQDKYNRTDRHTSSFFKAWAYALEYTQNVAEADRVFQTGFNSALNPAETKDLEVAYQAFQTRAAARQSGADTTRRAAPAANKGFTIFADDTPVAMAPPARAASVLHDNIPRQSSKTTIFRDAPDTAPAPSQSAPVSAPAQPVSKAKPTAAQLKNFAKERGQTRQTESGWLGYDPVPLYSGDDEMTFEELRARAWKPRAKPAPRAALQPTAVVMATRPAEPAAPAPVTFKTSRPHVAHEPASPEHVAPSVAPAARPMTFATAPPAPAPAAAPKVAVPVSMAPSRAASLPHSSPTITTKQALQDVFAMFGPSDELGIAAPVAPAPAPAAMAPPAKRTFFFDDENAPRAEPKAARVLDENDNDENAPPAPTRRGLTAMSGAAPMAVSGPTSRAALRMCPVETGPEDDVEDLQESAANMQQMTIQPVEDPRHQFEVYEDPTETVTTLPGGHLSNVSTFATFADGLSFAHSTPSAAKAGALMSAPESQIRPLGMRAPVSLSRGLATMQPHALSPILEASRETSGSSMASSAGHRADLSTNTTSIPTEDTNASTIFTAATSCPARAAMESQGHAVITMADILKFFAASGKFMDEPLIIYFSIEMLRAVETLHASGRGHGQLSAECFHLRQSGDGADELAECWDASGAGGWNTYGIQLCSHAPRKAGMQAMFDASQASPHAADYAAVLDVIHRLLQHAPMELTTVDGRQQLAHPLARYWQAALWTTVFNALLNINGTVPPVRREMEAFLMKNLTWRRLLRLALCRLENGLSDQ
eukprot:m.69402 g.69402  ORF g.69402 m.69402 type:complete len:857 (-) comp7550_c0_seq1:2038-4608(-)